MTLCFSIYAKITTPIMRKNKIKGRSNMELLENEHEMDAMIKRLDYIIAMMEE